jgi:glycosidase
VFGSLLQLITLRKANAALGGSTTEFLDSANDHVFAYARRNGAHTLLVVANCGEAPQSIVGNTLRLHGYAYHFSDLIGGGSYSAANPVMLAPYQVLWLVAEAE